MRPATRNLDINLPCLDLPVPLTDSKGLTKGLKFWLGSSISQRDVNSQKFSNVTFSDIFYHF